MFLLNVLKINRTVIRARKGVGSNISPRDTTNVLVLRTSSAAVLIFAFRKKNEQEKPMLITADPLFVKAYTFLFSR